MSTAVATRKKVNGIIPMGQLLEIMNDPAFDREKLREDLISGKIKEEGLSEDTKAEEGSGKKSIKEWFEEKKEKRAENRFNKIRNRLVAETLGRTLEQLDEYRADYERVSTGDVPSMDDGDILEDRRRVALGQANANKKQKRQALEALFKTAASAGFAYILTAVVLFPPAVSAAVGFAVPAAASFVITSIKNKKASRGSTADQREKDRNYMETLNNYMKRVEMLDEKINENRELIEANKKSMSKKEFEKWYEGYVKELKVAVDEFLEEQKEQSAKNQEEIIGE